MTSLSDQVRRLARPLKRLGSCAACGLASCGAPAGVESEPDPSSAVVTLVTDPGGLGIEGATITWGNQVYLTDETGHALVTLRHAAADGATERLHLTCPAGFAADAPDRVLPWVLLHGTPHSAVHFTCLAQRIRTALVVVVEGPGEVEVYRGEEALGSTRKGILHALLESMPETPLTLTLRPGGDEILEGDPNPVIVAGQNDTYALLPVTLKNPSRPRHRPTAPKRVVPYRL